MAILIPGKQIDTGTRGVTDANVDSSIIVAGGSNAFTADQAMGGFDLTGLPATPSGATAAASKAYVDSITAAGVTWREVMLVEEQLLAGGSGGILQAMVVAISTDPTISDIFVVGDGSTTETFTFVAAASVAFDVTIAGTAAGTMTNLVTAINADSTLWSAHGTTELDAYFAAADATQLVIFRTATSSANDRLYGTLTAPTGIQVVEFATGAQDYSVAAGTESDLPSSDPSAKRFGFGRAFASLGSNETHVNAEENGVHTWDTAGDNWQQIDVGGIAYGTPGAIEADDGAAEGVALTAARSDHTHSIVAAAAGAIEPDDAAAEGVATSFSRSDHTHSIVGAAAGAIEPDDAAAEGVATSFSRSDHTHSIVGAVAGAIEADDAAAEGVATSFSRSDHTHSIVTVAPGSLGAANAEGAASSFSRSDHTHARDTENVEAVTAEAITGTDTAISDGLNATPLAVTKVKLYLNGLLQLYGGGNDFTVSGTTITWLASSGTAVDLEAGDTLQAVYFSQG